MLKGQISNIKEKNCERTKRCISGGGRISYWGGRRIRFGPIGINILV
jgi:hypothetical protein